MPRSFVSMNFDPDFGIVVIDVTLMKGGTLPKFLGSHYASRQGDLGELSFARCLYL